MKRKIAVLLLAGVACGAMSRPSTVRDSTAPLAARSRTWLEQRECALSCHTTVPFVLAAEHLGPGAQSVRAQILARARARADSWPPAHPWYAMSPEKVAQSQGTEAVLNALALAGEAEAEAQAIANLFAEQRPDGGWDWLDFGLAPWEDSRAEVAGAALAAVAVGSLRDAVPPAPGIARLRGYLSRRAGVVDDLHNQVAILWASVALPGSVSEAGAQRLVKSVRAAQGRDGSWGAGDAQATAFAAFVLAQRTDPLDRSAAARGRRWLIDHQKPNGVWVGRSPNDNDRFNRELATDAATAFAVLALAQDAT